MKTNKKYEDINIEEVNLDNFQTSNKYNIRNLLDKFNKKIFIYIGGIIILFILIFCGTNYLFNPINNQIKVVQKIYTQIEKYEIEIETYHIIIDKYKSLENNALKNKRATWVIFNKEQEKLVSLINKEIYGSGIVQQK